MSSCRTLVVDEDHADDDDNNNDIVDDGEKRVDIDNDLLQW